jgi:UPF0755 protein
MADERHPDATVFAPQGGDPNAARQAPDVAPPIGRGPEPTRITPRSARTRLEPERVPHPTSRPSRRARHPIVIAGNAIFTTIIILAIVIGLTLAIGKQRFEAPGPLQTDKVVNIPRLPGTQDVADLLVREGVIDQKWVFIGGVFVLKARDEIKAGEYLFPKQASLRDVLDTFVEGKFVQHQITIPEGLTSEQIVARLLENDVLSGSLREIPREGTLLPETYKFVRGTTREQIVGLMQRQQKRILEDAWKSRNPDLPLRTPEQLIVMASIVEKETGRSDERNRVAAVFMNRLRQRMKLQSDPTIIYGLVGGKGSLGRPIMRSEIERPTPYNTYVIEGLPPGPIANPGRASIEAAANPSRTKELFFVADGSGGHAFAENLEQHNRNVARLRQLEQAAREGASAPPAAEPTAPALAPETAPSPAAPAAAPATPPRPQGRQGRSNATRP